MKKKILLLILSAFAVLSLTLVFAGCGGTDYKTSPSTQLFSAESMKGRLESFLTSGGADRTSQTTASETGGTDGEAKAAEWLRNELASIGGLEVENQEFTHTSAYGDEFRSQNVIAGLSADAANNPKKYKIVIGANYDNRYATVSMSKYRNSVYFQGNGAEAAMDNGTGVATVLALADYLADDAVRSKLTVDIDFVFYGMGAVDYYGSYYYLQMLGEAGRKNLMLAVNIERLGGDKLYAYFDEMSTPHGKFILETAAEAGFGEYISEPSSSQADYDSQMLESLPYTPPYLLSDAGQFFGSYNVCAVTSGIDNGFFLGDRETDAHTNISGTSNDTLAKLKELYPDYAEQMAVSAEILARSVLREGFTDALAASKDGLGGYMWLTVPWAAFTAVAVLSLGALIPIVVIVRNKERKYRESPDEKKNVKVAVFGMDFETPEENDVFIDIRSPEAVDPFADFDRPDDGDDHSRQDDGTEGDDDGPDDKNNNG